MNKEKREKPNQTNPQKAPSDEIKIESLPSASIGGERLLIEVGDEFNPNIVTLPQEVSPVRFVSGVIEIDSEALEAEKERTTNWLKNGILNGDEKILEVYLRNLIEIEDKEVAALRNQLTEAFRKKDPDILQLDALHVSLPTAGISERNLIREGLRPQIGKQPFAFKDKAGVLLSGDDNLDIVFSRRESKKDEFKIIIGSKRGIDSIVLPKELDPGKFIPDLDQIKRDAGSDAIIVPLKSAADGTSPIAAVIEIRKGPVDIISILAGEEREGSRRTRSRTEESDFPPSSPSYTPSPPRRSSGSWSSYSG